MHSPFLPTKSVARGARAACVLLLLPLLVAALPGCATRVVTHTERTATQQLLTATATERAVAALPWPALAGRRVFVSVASPAAEADRDYLRAVVQAALIEHGARPAADASQADLTLDVLASAVGTDGMRRFFGLPATESVLLPVTTPEIALYKSERQEGFVKLGAVLVDPTSGGLVQRLGPVQQQAHMTSWRLLFFGWRTTDTTRKAGPGFPSDGRGGAEAGD